MSLRLPDSGMRSADEQEISIDYYWMRREFSALTLDELLDRVRGWGAQPEALTMLPWGGRRNGDWMTLRCTTCVDIGEYEETWVSGRTPMDLWLQFIARAPI
jgi:hypothetical protein